jgi:two-component system, OmpR family, sensor histidine kinase KdpD
MVSDVGRLARVLVAVAAVIAVGTLAWLVSADLTAAALVLLVTVLALGLMGVEAAIAAAITGFLVLNIVFTQPTGSLAIDRSDDVVALIVFAVSAAIAGFGAQQLSRLRELALRREQEARLQLDLANILASSDDIDDALRAAAATLLDLFELERCDLRAGDAQATTGDPAGEVNVRVESAGVVLLARAEHEPDASDRALLEALVGGLATAVDRLRLRAEVREAQLVAEVGRQRAGFLSAVSHNLRTPLTAVKAAAGTLLASWSRLEPEERRELLETIADEAERLERLVRNTLELSRIRAGALEVALEPVDIGDLVQHAVRRLRPIARAHRVRLDVADDLGEVWLDVTMLEQILLNLLENALRFAPPGSEILVGARPVDGDLIELRVTDHGPGVPAEARERIFEEFRSADDRPDRAGTGLGLAIVRALVVAHGGSVRYEDTPGGGATFVCTFPRGEPS